MLRAMVENAPAQTVASDSYKCSRRGLMLYGPGAPYRLPIIKAHIARGGRVAMWDLGYWQRHDAMRLSIDALHPSAKHLAMAPPGPGRREFALRDDADANGPILLIGLGPKSVSAYGLKYAQAWEIAQVKSLRARYPNRQILWRPKGAAPVPLMGLTIVHGMPIEGAMRGCSLVVCRHSNVAVDAAVAGIPVECEDGAAFALYRDNPAPTREQRAEFLRQLSFWEWSGHEAAAAWQWIKSVTGV